MSLESSICHDFDEPTSVTASAVGCEDCERTGGRWVHLRICLACGHVGCCDDSPNRHATAHARETAHPVIASFETGEHWGYCYPHDAFVERLPPAFSIRRRTGGR
jgi:uncharacterized UBP type Zn finger protein